MRWRSVAFQMEEMTMYLEASKAAAMEKAEVSETARVEANKEKCKCYEDMQGLVMCKKCHAPMSEHEFNRRLKEYDGYVKLS